MAILNLSEISSKAVANWPIILGFTLLIAFVHEYIIYPFYTSPLAGVPGPKLNAMTKWWMMWIDYSKKRTLTIHEMHKKYGPVVRITPNELAFTGEEPMKVIYGAGTSFSKPAFYDLFIAYLLKHARINSDTAVARCSPCWGTKNTANDERQSLILTQRPISCRPASK